MREYRGKEKLKRPTSSLFIIIYLIFSWRKGKIIHKSLKYI